MIKCSYCDGRHALASEARDCWENTTGGATKSQPRTRTTKPGTASNTSSKSKSTGQPKRTIAKKAKTKTSKTRKKRRRSGSSRTTATGRTPTGKTWTRNREPSRQSQIPSASGKAPAAPDVVEEMGRRVRKSRSSPRRMHDRGGTPTVQRPADGELHKKIGRADPEDRDY